MPTVPTTSVSRLKWKGSRGKRRSTSSSSAIRRSIVPKAYKFKVCITFERSNYLLPDLWDAERNQRRPTTAFPDLNSSPLMIWRGGCVIVDREESSRETIQSNGSDPFPDEKQERHSCSRHCPCGVSNYACPSLRYRS